jgi:hypothetical protein
LSYLLLKVEQGFLSEDEADLLMTKPKVNQPPSPPPRVRLIQHLTNDIYALREFFDLASPPEIQA